MKKANYLSKSVLFTISLFLTPTMLFASVSPALFSINFSRSEKITKKSQKFFSASTKILQPKVFHIFGEDVIGPKSVGITLKPFGSTISRNTFLSLATTFSPKNFSLAKFNKGSEIALGGLQKLTPKVAITPVAGYTEYALGN